LSNLLIVLIFVKLIVKLTINQSLLWSPLLLKACILCDEANPIHSWNHVRRASGSRQDVKGCDSYLYF